MLKGTVAFVVSVAACSAFAAEPGLVVHLAPEACTVEGTTLRNAAGATVATIHGTPEQVMIGPGAGVAFDGMGDWLTLASDIASRPATLPKRDFTAAAWVNITTPVQYGCIVGAIQDNGNFEKGWLLGYSEDAFYIGVSSTGADDGDGKLTYMKGKTRLEPGRWYHVAGVYDGVRMRLYVNGALDAESTEQSGDILYPAHAEYTAAAYRDENESFPLHGAIAELKVYDRALSADAIGMAFRPGAALAAYQPPVDATPRFVVKPYLQFATRDSITVMAETATAATGHVLYGTQLPPTQKSAEGAPGTMHEIRLTGLEPGKPYFYRFVAQTNGGGVIEGDVSTFQTALGAEDAYSFAVIGDTQKNAPVIERLQTFAWTLRPNFEIHLGDVVNTGPDKSEWVNELLPGSHALWSRVPVYPSIGNHEQNHSFYYGYFALPAPEYYYTFTYGNAQFWVLDTNKPVGPGTEQWNWLEKSLAESTATWKFAYHHHPVYSSDENDYGDTYKGPSANGDMKVRPLAELYEKYGLDINFNGHIHVYERTWPIRDGKVDDSGVIYITSGGGGGGLEAPAPVRTWFMRRFYAGHHILYLTIHGGELQLQAFDLEGRLFDQMELRKPEHQATAGAGE